MLQGCRAQWSDSAGRRTGQHPYRRVIVTLQALFFVLRQGAVLHGQGASAGCKQEQQAMPHLALGGHG